MKIDNIIIIIIIIHTLQGFKLKNSREPTNEEIGQMLEEMDEDTINALLKGEEVVEGDDEEGEDVEGEDVEEEGEDVVVVEDVAVEGEDVTVEGEDVAVEGEDVVKEAEEETVKEKVQESKDESSEIKKRSLEEGDNVTNKVADDKKQKVSDENVDESNSVVA